MMRILFFPLLLVMAQNAAAQRKGTATLYGFKQAVSGGKRPTATEGPVTSTGAATNYFLYATATGRLYPLAVWVDGKRLGVTVRSVPSPVTRPDISGTTEQVLVPATPQTVWQLTPNRRLPVKAAAPKAEAAARKNGLVLLYRQNGKLYYAALAQWKDLDAAAMQ